MLNLIEENVQGICFVLFIFLMVGAVALGIWTDKSNKANTYVYGELLDGEIVRVEYYPHDRQTFIGLYDRPVEIPFNRFKRIWKEEARHAKR